MERLRLNEAEQVVSQFTKGDALVNSSLMTIDGHQREAAHAHSPRKAAASSRS